LGCPLLTIDEVFSTYRDNYPARDPDASEIASDDERRMITQQEGLQELAPPPINDLAFGTPPYEPRSATNEKYLWVVRPDAVPFALELLSGVEFKRGCLSHTNLTGGKPAHSGGEMWFVDPETVVLNGGSGRYPPRSPAELEALTVAFKTCGFRVASMGWDEGVDAPARYLRGAPKWA
jgi:hypothetical protein